MSCSALPPHPHPRGPAGARVPVDRVQRRPDRQGRPRVEPVGAGRLALEAFRRAQYESAVLDVERGDAEDDHEHRMRIMIHLHLTRFLRFLLDRKDRLSMAVGLEVRVPFCDHRLVEYVYNAPWSFKHHDGREKSLLRSAVKDVLPESVAWRVKSPYPSTQDPYYVRQLQAQAEELLSDRGHGVFELVDREWLREVTGREPAAVDRVTRLGLERALDFGVWLDLYRPDLTLS
ncbi:asparagine synthase-related protein [Saccharothrix sp. S26]|uniref:asparagine synthase-related protein n=1 Tax=Saccharothrix sp. S26 TaxID=2907215 RepID=UPI0035ABDD38